MSRRLLYLISDLHVGGACSLMINNAVELKKRGHHVHIIYFAQNEELMSRILSHNLNITRFAYTGGISRFIKVVSQLRKFISENKIDIIHCNLHLDTRFGFAASMVSGTPLVVTLHGLRFATNDYRSVKYRALQYLEDALLKKARKLIAVSEAVRNSQVPWLRNKTEVIYSGIPVIQSQSENRIHSHEGLVLLHLGRIHPIKNQLFSVELIRKMKASNYDAKLMIVGAKEGAYYDTLVRKVKEYGLESTVEFKGSTANAEAFYRQADFVVVPSHSESFGLVAAEAMQCGVVVVAADVPGLNELMVHGNDGFYFKPNDVDNAMEIVVSLFRDKDAYKLVSQNAKNSFMSKFTIERSVDRIAELYETLLSKGYH